MEQGVAYYRENRYPDAMGKYARALEVDPENDEALVGRGVVYVAISKFV